MRARRWSRRALLPLAAVALVLGGACAKPNFGEDPAPELDSTPEGGTRPDSAVLPRSDSAPPDSGDPADSGTDPDADGGKSLRVFVTSKLVTGNLLGLAGGDIVCNDLATAQSLGGTWSAWLSNQGGPHAVDRLTSAGPWRLVTGDLVALTKAELTTGPLRHAIDRDEKGAAVASIHVWTGTGPDGRYSTNDCDKWTGNGGNTGRHGDTAGINGMWTSSGTDDCNNLRPLYCFER